jgi:hypothetical protein
MGSGLTKHQKLNDQPTPLKRTPPPGVAKDACGRHVTSIAAQDAQRQGGGSLFFPCHGKVFLAFAGQFHETRRQSDVLVDRIALIVARNHFRAPFVGHGSRDLIQACLEQIGNDFFDRLAGK